MATANWRTINIDLLDPESSANFDTKSLVPPVASISASEVQNIASQVRQLLRGGDSEGALRGALEHAPYGGDSAAKEVHLATVVEILQSIKQSEMSPVLSRIYKSPGGVEILDVLMKYLFVLPPRVPENPSVTPPRFCILKIQSPSDRHCLFLRYKGMSQTSQPSSASTRGLSPQPTGFSQIQSRSAGEGGGQAMSVLLSWHERLAEIVGTGSIVRVMSDRRTV